MAQQQTHNNSKRDEEYKNSAQPIVDRAMEAQNLAPAIVVAIKENKPLNDELKGMFRDTLNSDKEFNDGLEMAVTDMLRNNKNVQEAVDEVVSNNEAIKKSKSPTKTKEFWIPIVISIVSGLAAVVAAAVSIIALNKQ